MAHSIRALAIHHDGQRIIAVRCLNEKNEVAQKSANMASSILNFRTVCQDKVTGALRDELWIMCGKSEDVHSDWAQISDGPWAGLKAIGIGSNKVRRTRAGRIALMLQAHFTEYEQGINGIPKACSSTRLSEYIRGDSGLTALLKECEETKASCLSDEAAAGQISVSTDPPCMTLPLGAMAASLTLYLVIAKAGIEVVVTTAKVPLRCAGVHSYVGLRQRPVDAVHRCNASFPGGVSAGTHVLLSLTFTTKGIARYCTETTDAAHGFVPVLAKQVYADTSRDWGVWHFIGDLPLDEPNHIIPVWRDITDRDLA